MSYCCLGEVPLTNTRCVVHWSFLKELRAKINCQIRSIKWRAEVMEKFVCVFSATTRPNIPDTHACWINFGGIKIINTVPAKKEISELCWDTSISETGNALSHSSYPLQTSLISFVLPSLHLSWPLLTCTSINSRRNRIILLFVWSSITMHPNQSGLD